MRMLSKLSTIALLAALAAPLGLPAAVAQDNAATASQPEACDIGPDLSAEALRQIEDLTERRRMLSCMIGPPRDYQGELAQRQPGGEIRAVNVEEVWGQDFVAEGLEASAEANAAVTGDLQAAVEADEELSGFLDSQGYRSLGVIGYRINLVDGSTDIFLAPMAGAEYGGQTPEGATDEDVENEAMAESMEEAVEEGMEEEGAGSSQ
ncbi:MAG TPA: hypothetical protein VGN80_02380 [Devosiaceae bacterium]|nr:hypothetical protein [Devosiaceae bacterium]